MVQESATWDETNAFGIGKYLLQTGKWDIKGSILHPPLPYYLSSIPLLFFPTGNNAFWQFPAGIKSRYIAQHPATSGAGAIIKSGNWGDRF